MKRTEIDIIILSFAKDYKLKSLTEQTIETLLASEDSKVISFNIIVIESNKSLQPYQFENSKTIYPEEDFGFHKYLNIGIQVTNNKYVCLCNNDLIFHKGWASKLIETFTVYPNLKSLNPLCQDFEPTKTHQWQQGIVCASRKNIFKGILTGWCIFVKREIFDHIGPLDERFDFWYADRDYGKTLLKYKIKHALVPQSKVTHIGNQSHESIADNLINKFTVEQKKTFDKKWNKGIIERIEAYFQNFYQ